MDKILNFLLSLSLSGAGVLFSSSVLAQEKCTEIFQSSQFQGRVTQGNAEYGPSLFYIADSSLRGPLPKKLTFGTYNLLNLFEHTLNQGLQGKVAKPDEKRQGNARAIEDMAPDFMTGVEVENLQAFKLFNDIYLKNHYQPLLIEGNDPRGIDVGLLVRKDLPVDIEWRSFKNFSIDQKQPVFSRDLPVGIIYERDSNGLKKNVAKFVIIATHYKSKRTNANQKDTSLIRAGQVKATLEIVKMVQEEFGAQIPIILSGDFNNKIHGSPEFQTLFNQGFKDTLDLTPNPASQEDRSTHYYFSQEGGRDAQQMDAILILGSQKMRVVQSRVIPDTDASGKILSAPRTFKEREQRPSDHRPIAAEIEIR